MGKFKFKLNNKKHKTIYVAEEKEFNYVVKEYKGKVDSSITYQKFMVDYALTNNKWIIVTKENKIFTVKYYNNALQQPNEKSFNKKKDALSLIEILKSLPEIRDIKLFKTKEISLSE